MKRNTIHPVSLGCAKNMVDTDSMSQLLLKAGYQLVDDPDEAKVIIVNTCGFIGPAKDESYQVLEEFAGGKSRDQLLIAAGCLTQRYGAEVARRIPGIDGILGTRRWLDILEVVEALGDGKQGTPHYHLPDTPAVGVDEMGILRAAVQGSKSYGIHGGPSRL